MFCQPGEDVDVSSDQQVLGNNDCGIPEVGKHFKATSRQFQPPLDGLVAISYSAQSNDLWLPFWRQKLLSQQLRRVFLHHNLRLKIQTGRKTEIFMEWTSVTIDAPVLATAI